MRIKPMFLTVAIALMTIGAASHAETLQFSGYTWEVRPSGRGGPGPNDWDPNNVWVDNNGSLHLKLTQRNGKWSCPEVYTQKRLGFGHYQFWITGRVDKLDPNIVFGIFNYPTSDVGPDRTHEIDIEFANWGNPRVPIGNYTVWPVAAGMHNKTKAFPFTLNSDESTHSFTWSPTSVLFQSYCGHTDADDAPFSSWAYEPQDPEISIAQKPMPLHINLWCFKGQMPIDGQEVELIIRAFKFTPM